MNAVSQAFNIAASVALSSNNIADSAEMVSNSTTKSAAAILQTSTSTAELSKLIQTNLDGVQVASQLSEKSKTTSFDGKKQAESLTVTMNTLFKNTKQIEDITSLIDNIAFQTNLLALNAAVEAARAGDSGKGFAIVANAVRELAQKSSSSAKGISDLIGTAVDQIKKSVNSTESSTAALTNIVDFTSRVSDINKDISKWSAQQSNGIKEIAKALEELDSVTQQNASASEQLAFSSKDLSAEASKLKDLTSILYQLVQGA